MNAVYYKNSTSNITETITLDRWGLKTPPTTQRQATKADVEPLFNTFQRIRKLEGFAKKFTNVTIEWGLNYTKSKDEWALVVEVKEINDGFKVTAVPLGTTDKAKAVRRAYGWGLKNEKGEVNWPYRPNITCPVPDEPHYPDVDEAAYFNYWRF